ncbi:C39 family peptidase [Aeromonas enteropelogenes]|uniref:C39 family peptidase n=1 Tax=Aeromonas enteropelogenes TaxID=29489 RepID=UPI003B9EE1AE
MRWLLPLLFSPVVWSATLPMGEHLSALGGLAKPVQSIQERRYANLERQHTDFSCGAAAVATILRHAYGQATNERWVMDGMMAMADPAQVKRYGFSMLDMKQYLQMLGMRARGYRLSDTKLRQVRVPTIVLLNIRGYQHFAVLRAIDRRDRVYLADPALGNRIISFREFKESWNGILLAVIGAGYRPDAPLANPSPPFSARGRDGLFAPVNETSLLDFGFQHKELM